MVNSGYSGMLARSGL